MNLNRQLLCVSLVLLSLPWAGCQYMREMDSILRSGQEQALAATTTAIAQVLSQQTELLYPHGEFYSPDQQLSQPLYFHPLKNANWVDGYVEGWEKTPREKIANTENTNQLTHFRSGIYQDQLHLLFEVEDRTAVYNNPLKSQINHGDRVVLIAGNSVQYTFTTAAPGKVGAKYLNNENRVQNEEKIVAYWQDTQLGYNLELSIPSSLAKGRISFYIVDSDGKSESQYGPYPTSATFSAIAELPPFYITQVHDLENQLSIFGQPGTRFRIVDPYFWTLANAGSMANVASTNSHWLIKKIYRSLLDSRSAEFINVYKDGNKLDNRAEVAAAMRGVSKNQSHHAWYAIDEQSNNYVLSSAAAIRADTGEQSKIVGVIVAEQSSEQLATLTDSAFNRLLLLSGLAIAIVIIGLLGYASLLSWRISRLSRSAKNAMDDKGKIVSTLPGSKARDEIGELTRNYSHLLERVSGYTNYLQTLSRKLSHELRTPLAIIHTSLDNLQQQALNEDSQVFQNRAKEGATRLGTILTAMSEASRVEESIEHSELEQVKIADLLGELSSAYSEIYPKHHISFKCPDNCRQISLKAAPDLLVQMFDKLINNAASFCPQGKNISFTIANDGSFLTINLENDGPLLPENMRSQLFDNMVSLRQKDTNSSHLGLGLHIVRLIVAHHNGVVSAHNRADETGVIFSIKLPL